MSKDESDDAIYGDAFDPGFDDDGRVTGYSFTGTKGRALFDWQERKGDAEFQALCAKLRQKQWWRALTDEERAAVYEYRRAWARTHSERTRVHAKKAAAKRVESGKAAAYARRLRKRARAARIKGIVWTCVQCGAEHQPNPLKRLPTRTPEYCSQGCKSRAQYRRDKATVSPVPISYGGRIRTLRELGGEFSAARLVAELGYSKIYARSMLIELFGRGHLDRVSRGRYRMREGKR